MLELEVLILPRELPEILRGKVTGARHDFYSGAIDHHANAPEFAVRARIGRRIPQQVIT